jgi:hypothetical protein
VTFTKPDDGDPSCQDNDRDADGHSVGDGICDFITGRGSDYSIASHVSGAFLFFPADSKYFNAANYGKFLASARSALGSGDLIAGYYGDAFGESNLYPDVLQKEIDTARPYARGVLLWDPPLDLAQLDSSPPEGTFADVSAEITSYDHSSFWHGYNNGLRGWHQAFTHTGGQSGAISMTLHDVETAGTDGAEDNFYKTITDTEGHTYYRDGVDGVECTGTSSLEACPGVEEGLACMRICEAGDEHEYLTIDLGSTTTDLSVSMQLTDGVSNGYAGVATGWSVPDPAAWDYSTGVTENCYSLEYAAVLGAYAGVGHGPFNEDTDADGLHDCIDPEPTAANRWYWVNKDLASDCSAADHEAHTYEFVRGNAPSGGPGTPPASVAGVLKPGKAQAAVLTDCEDPNSVSYGVYVEL